ncbi:hypothetical protein D9M68_816030 [compost metagenome]
MLQPAATAFLLWLLQANAKVESARVKMKPPWQIWWPLRCKGCTAMRMTARPGSQLSSSMPMVSLLAVSTANMVSPTLFALS